MTVYEQLAKTFPLHFQRIVEIVYEQAGSGAVANFALRCPSAGTGEDLAGVFNWARTSEGHDYWEALYIGATS